MICNLINNKAITLLYVSLLLTLMPSCVFLQANKWNSFEVVVEVQNQNGAVIKGAIIQYDSNSNVVTDKYGQAALYYSQEGLHIIIVKAQGMYTEQLKIKTPNDANKIVVLKLKNKNY